MTTPAQSLHPTSLNLLLEDAQRCPIAGYPKIIEVSLQYRLEPRTLLRYRPVPITDQFIPDFFDLGPEPLAHGFAVYCEASVPLLCADVRESKEVECFRLLVSALLAVFYGEPPELNEPGFIFVHFQAELCHSFFQSCLKPLRI